MPFLIVLLIFFFALLIALVCVVRFETLCCWQESVLQILKGGRYGTVRLFFFAALFGFFSLGLRIHTLRLPPICHRSILVLVCIYTFVFFNPQAALSTSKQGGDVYCPDGYAFKVDGGHYIACEDFDEFHEERSRGKTRTDLYLRGGK